MMTIKAQRSWGTGFQIKSHLETKTKLPSLALSVAALPWNWRQILKLLSMHQLWLEELEQGQPSKQFPGTDEHGAFSYLKKFF